MAVGTVIPESVFRRLANENLREKRRKYNRARAKRKEDDMSKQTESRDVYTCDGCGKSAIEEVGDMPGGYHGTAYEVNEALGGGSMPTTWYACKISCVKAAVFNTARRGWDSGD